MYGSIYIGKCLVMVNCIKFAVYTIPVTLDWASWNQKVERKFRHCTGMFTGMSIFQLHYSSNIPVLDSITGLECYRNRCDQGIIQSMDLCSRIKWITSTFTIYVKFSTKRLLIRLISTWSYMEIARYWQQTLLVENGT